MPGFFGPTINRKQFLQTSGAIAASLLVPNTCNADDTEDTKVAQLALLSDTHIPADPTNGYRDFLPVDNLKKVVPQAVAVNPEAAILNGDAARLVGSKEDYVALKSLLQPLAEKCPIHIGLGNHDHRDNFFDVFSDAKPTVPLVEDKHVTTFEMSGTRFVVLDSLMYVDKVAGLMGKAQREWLAEFLEETDDKPIVFFVHHTLEDRDSDLLDFDRVFRIMQPHRKVKAIFYGHSHRYQIQQREHIYLINQPAIGYNFNDEQPVGWLDAKFTTKEVSLTLQTVAGNETDNGKTQTVVWAS